MESDIVTRSESFIVNRRSSWQRLSFSTDWIGDEYRRFSEKNGFQYFENTDHEKIMDILKKCSHQDFVKFPKNHFIVIDEMSGNFFSSKEFYKEFCKLPETFRKKITFIFTTPGNEIAIRNEFENLPTSVEIKEEPFIVGDFIDGLAIARDDEYIRDGR